MPQSCINPRLENNLRYFRGGEHPQSIWQASGSMTLHLNAAPPGQARDLICTPFNLKCHHHTSVMSVAMLHILCHHDGAAAFMKQQKRVQPDVIQCNIPERNSDWFHRITAAFFLVCFLFCRTSSCVCCALVFKMLQLMCLQFTWLKKNVQCHPLTTWGTELSQYCVTALTSKDSLGVSARF